MDRDAVSASASRALAATHVTASSRVQRLDNGVRLVTAPMRERASVTVAFMFAVGSRWENDADAGVAHFLEHMLFKGGEKFATARAVSEAIESVGGVINAATDREGTVFWVKVPAQHIDTAIDVLTDIVVAPGLDPAEVAKERLVVVEEIRMYQDSPQDHVQTVFDEVMWPAHPLGRDIAGSEATVMAFDQAQCKSFVETHYRPESLVVSIAGAFDPHAAAAHVKKRLGSWQPTGRGPTETPRDAIGFSGPALRLVTRRTEQAAIVIGVRAPSYLSEDRYAVDILNCILGEGMSSRLFLELREEHGLAYDISSYTVKLRDSGALCIGLGCDPKRAVSAMGAAVKELRRLASEDVATAELEKAKDYTIGRLLVQLESTSALCNYYGQQESTVGEIEEPQTVVDRVRAVTAGDVRRVASAILHPDNGGLRAAVVGPFRSVEKLERALASA